MFRSLSFVGVASAAIIESRPHEHLQMANAQLQNATEAVIKTAAVAGLAYAGAYMAAAGTTPGAYDSSRRSQASSTGQRYCDTRQSDPTKWHCTAEYFNGVKSDNANPTQLKVAVRNYWCCPAQDLGGKYSGDMNGVCVSENNGASVFASTNQGAGGCVYQGPCVSGYNTNNPYSGSNNVDQITGFTATNSAPTTGVPDSRSQPSPATGTGNDIEVGSCGGGGFDGTITTAGNGIFGGSPGGSSFSGTVGGTAAAPTFEPNTIAFLGGASGKAYYNGDQSNKCCVKTDQGSDGIKVYDLNPAVLKQPISFCIPLAVSDPAEYTCTS